MFGLTWCSCALLIVVNTHGAVMVLSDALYHFAQTGTKAQKSVNQLVALLSMCESKLSDKQSF